MFGNHRIYNQDIRDWIEEYDGPKFLATISDPPYHLTSITKRFGKEGSAPAKPGKDGAFSRLSRGFMSQIWDGGDIAFDSDVWRGIGEHLYPGAFGMAFSTRNWHRLAVAIEDAGFIIHPSIFLWLNGEGFPKATKIKSDNEEQENLWSGHRYGGQVLKPTVEVVLLFQKPYPHGITNSSISIVESGAGALNIDGTRIGTTDNLDSGTRTTHSWKNSSKVIYNDPGHKMGRWPTNLILIHTPNCKIVGYDESGYTINRFDDGAKPFGSGRDHPYTGEEISSKAPIWRCVPECPVHQLAMGEGKEKFFWQAGWGYDILERLENSNNPIYCPKAKPKEKDAGLEDFPDIVIDDGRVKSIDNQFQRGKTIRKNPHPCLSGDSLIWVNNKISRIDECKIGDLVLGQDGNIHKIVDFFKVPYNKTSYQIGTSGTNLSITASDNHPFLIYTPIRDNGEIVDHAIGWKRADELSVGDYTLSPVINGDRVFGTEDFYYLLGFWCAEGSKLRNGHGSSVFPVFSVHEGEEKIIRGLVNPKTNVGIYPKKSTHSANVIIFDGTLLKEYVKMCGEYAHKKYISNDLMMSKRNLKSAFLHGYLRGDGNTCDSYGEERWRHYRAKTVSRDLAYGLILLAESIGYKSAVYEYPGNENAVIEGREVNTRTTYQLYFYPPRGKKGNQIKTRQINFNGNEYFFRRIKSIKEKTIDFVYNITVDNANTFQTWIGMSHNTVKPLSLIRYLSTLLLPPEGYERRLLVPFSGTGSEMIGGLLSGFDYVVGVEMGEEYIPFAEARIKFWKKMSSAMGDYPFDINEAVKGVRTEEENNDGFSQLALF